MWALNLFKNYNGMADLAKNRRDKYYTLGLDCSPLIRLLDQLAAEITVTAPRQNQVSALLFLYREVLDFSLDLTFQPVRAERQKFPPAVP